MQAFTLEELKSSFPDSLTVKASELAAVINVSSPKLRALCNKGKLAHFRLNPESAYGGSVYFKINQELVDDLNANFAAFERVA